MVVEGRPMRQRKHRARLRLPFRYRNIFGVLNTEQTMTFRRAAAVLCLAIIPMTLAACRRVRVPLLSSRRQPFMREPCLSPTRTGRCR